ncbi:cytochrome P450 [Podospora fimiseda]|uniref:Cytochrome P450 n=1 Tax=Podospora fimiseda TaxID=252190 RepID=A0AAN7BEF5_9PEZI|nr:cytochrome P450 [Podospora fimiseda]
MRQRKMTFDGLVWARPSPIAHRGAQEFLVRDASHFLPCKDVNETNHLQRAYNLLLHPLRNIPSPKLWTCSQLPYTYHWIRGELTFVVHDLHKIYGDTVRLTPNRVAFAHPDAWQQIRENGKDPVWYHMSRLNILGADRKNHSRVLRTLASGFSAKAIQAQEGLLAGYVDLFISQLKKLAPATHDGGGGVVDLSAWLSFFAFDIIADLSFGESPFNCLANGVYHPWVYTWLAGGGGDGQKKIGLDQQLEYALAQVKKRLEDPDGLRDEKRKANGRDKVIAFIGAMTTTSNSNPREMTEHEIAANAMLLVTAGSETATTALACAVYYIASISQVQKRLAEEYMLAVLDEAMRRMPPVPRNMPRVVGAKGGDAICGWYLQYGTVLDIWPWAINHLENNFTKAYDFIPERWLDVDEFEGVRFNKDRYGASQPFSVGPRNCISKNLAYLEMRMVLARLVWNFDLELFGEEAKKFPDCKGYAVWIKRRLYIELKPVLRD